MSETDAMTINERRKYIYKIWGKYRQATKAEKGKMLDEMVYVTGMNRNDITQLLNGRLSRKQRVRQRGPSYSPEVLEVVRVTCAERLKQMLTFMAEHLMRQGQL